jgi:hypothetical protein
MSNKHTISVLDLCGPTCVSDKNGYNICEAVHYALHPSMLPDGDVVVMDFAGVEVLTPAFLNAAVSCLYDGSNTPEFLRKHVEYVGLDEDNKRLLDVIISNAQRFYRASEKQQASIVDATLRPLVTCQ